MSTDRTTEILRYLSAMSQEFGEFRTKLNAMGTDVGTLRTEVGEMRVEMHTGFGELRKEVRALTNRLNRLEAKFINAYTDVDELDIRVSALEGKQE